MSGIVWPSEVYRAVIADGLDAVRAAEEDRDSWRVHAQLDHAALGRAWSCITAWTEVADRWPDELGLATMGLHPATLRACAQMLQERILTDAADPDAGPREVPPGVWHTTGSGRVLTGPDLDALAAEAEAGYDPAVLRRRAGGDTDA